MNELTARQEKLLLLIIRDYIESESAQPVGSKRLVEHYRLGFSPATIRNEMSALTEMGYLRQPHARIRGFCLQEEECLSLREGFR